GVAVSILLVPLAVHAASLPEPKVDYSADSTMETEGGMTMKSRVYHSSGKQRMEMGGADGSVTIIRNDKKVMWQLIGNMYMEMPIDRSDSSDLSSMDVEQTVVGEETVNGIKTTKSKVIATKKDGSKFGGFFWTTKDGITVKMDLLSKEGDQKMRMMSELTNLKIEKQDPKLFEIPAGYTKNDMGALMGQGGAPNIQEMMKGAGRSKGKEGEDAVDMNKMLKGLLGR
ncbi:MAG: DUF4412 domain-containing protein, partial [Nitrospira sp.]|nr:DUF4412 domain-containing protein [Nitrospira sp.]